MSATGIENLEANYAIDKNDIVVEHIEPSTISTKFNIHQASFGKHKVHFRCPKLKIDTSVIVFTFKNNYLDFEIQNEHERKPIVLARYSWFPLVYM